jgi:hypothetical protein
MDETVSVLLEPVVDLLDLLGPFTQSGYRAMWRSTSAGPLPVSDDSGRAIPKPPKKVRAQARSTDLEQTKPTWVGRVAAAGPDPTGQFR